MNYDFKVKEETGQEASPPIEEGKPIARKKRGQKTNKKRQLRL